ncbi:tetratricopeptide repeat protein, partial [Microcoleus anatoxicus]|uniref:tetratricopeptide repeat protein n=1 Tax=Microcoleus anatoxicus TaxID=2705319 RepID=UPI0030C9636A
NPDYMPAYQSLLPLQPDNWEAWWQLGNLHAKQGEDGSAIVAYQRVIELKPDYMPAHQKLVSLQPDNWEAWWQLGNLHTKLEQAQDAIVSYNQVLQLHPEAVQAYQELLKLQPDNWEAWWCLGNIYAQQNQWEEAIVAYRNTILLNPECYDCYSKLGDLLVEKGQVVHAIQFYQQAISINPEQAQIYFQLGKALVQQKTFDQAIENYEQAIKINPDLLVEGISNVASALRQNDEFEKAVYYCEEFLKIYPKSTEGYVTLAHSLLVQGKLNEAFNNYYQANQIKFAEVKARGKIPSIMFNTLPKSGSAYVFSTLSKGLQLPAIRVSSSTFPDDVISIEQLNGFALKTVISQEHFPASLVNLNLLKAFVDRLIVNVRDLRQGLLSVVHHFRRDKAQNPLGLLISPSFLPEKYFFMSLSEQISWQIEKGYLPAAIKWIEGWLDAEEDSSFYPKILFTKHEDLATNPEAYFESILKFYEIDNARFTFPEKPKFDSHTHQRKGSIDEWRTVFTAEQAEEASGLIPERLIKRFGWPRS